MSEPKSRDRDADDDAGDEGSGLHTAFVGRTATAFASMLDAEVVLEASSLVKPLVGRDDVGLLMSAASAVYEAVEFADPVRDGMKDFIEWRARALGGVELRGVTVLTRNASGVVVHVAIHQRPLLGALRFSNALAKRLNGLLDASHFFCGDAAERFLSEAR